MADKDKVVGKALYLELRNTGSTYQMIITPDGVSSSGRAVPAMVYRRQISEAKPRKAWKTMSFPALPLNAFGAYDPQDMDAARSVSGTRVNTTLASIFRQLSHYSYTLYKTPIYVEVSAEDIETIRLCKTPYKVLGRITRVRKTLGFGDALFNS
jgi:hypothetical protein